MLSYFILLLVVTGLSQTISVRKEHSLTPPYVSDASSLQTWDLTGNTELTDHFIRLTPDEEHKSGAIWNNYPCFSNNWEFQVQFQIHGKGVHLFGDGLAIWYVKESDMLHSGPVFGSKDYFTGLGVFIDTFSNTENPHEHKHPYISAMVNNGSIHYEHEEDGTMTQVGGCHAFIRNLAVPPKIAVSYINNMLSLYLDNEGTGEWQLCFKAEGVHLPTGYHFGISASTSDMTDNHDIIAATALNLDPGDMEWQDKTEIIPAVDNLNIPLKYHKEYIEKQLKKHEKRAADEDEGDDDADTDDESEEKEDTNEAEATDESSLSTPLIRKLVYVTGAAALILVSISVYKKYKERRRIQIEKRLF